MCRSRTHIWCIVVFPLQQWLRERTTVLRYTYVIYLVWTSISGSGYEYNHVTVVWIIFRMEFDSVYADEHPDPTFSIECISVGTDFGEVRVRMWFYLISVWSGKWLSRQQEGQSCQGQFLAIFLRKVTSQLTKPHCTTTEGLQFRRPLHERLPTSVYAECNNGGS